MAKLTERDLENPEPLRIDREVASAARAVTRFRRRLASGEGFDDDPFLASRLVTGRTAFQAILGLPESDPLRAPLSRWVYHLADARINLTSTLRIAAEYRLAEHVTTEPERLRTSLASILRRALAEPKRRDGWLSSYLRACETLATAEAVRWERRAEIAARLGISGPDAMEGVGADVYAAAERWLDLTDDAFGSVAPDSLAGVVSLALAEDAPGDYPRHLLPRNIQDFFRETDLLRSIDLDPGPLPEPVAPASFPRALALVFASWVDATAPKDQPFVVAHDPLGLARYIQGALFGALPSHPAFARRVFNVDPAKLGDYQRRLGAALLVESRALALRVVLRRAALEGRKSFGQSFESGTERAFGIPLPERASGALFRLRHDDLQRFSGFLLAATRGAALRDDYDEDWYRNPRAIERLRDESRLSPVTTTTDEALHAAESTLYAAVTAAL